jgi:hypothetical protein
MFLLLVLLLVAMSRCKKEEAATDTAATDTSMTSSDTGTTDTVGTGPPDHHVDPNKGSKPKP